VILIGPPIVIRIAFVRALVVTRGGRFMGRGVRFVGEADARARQTRADRDDECT